MNLHEQKKTLREELKRRRNAIPAAERHEKSARIMKNLAKIDEFSSANSVFCYISYLSEVDTKPILDQFLEQQIRIAVPKIIDSTVMHSVSFSGWCDLQKDKMGILTPISDKQDPGPFDLVLAPGLGFTNQGGRLGYGRGYYDRWFAKHKVKSRIGVAFEAQLVNSLPIEDTDMPLHMLVTEKQVYDFRN